MGKANRVKKRDRIIIEQQKRDDEAANNPNVVSTGNQTFAGAGAAMGTGSMSPEPVDEDDK
jgi:hypothetical protein